MFLTFITRLKKEGYLVETKEYDTYTFYRVKGNRIFGGFCTMKVKPQKGFIDPYGPRPELINRIAADHKECFDKWRKCAVQLPLPTNQKQLKYLINKLEYLGTDEGLAWAAGCYGPDEKEYPF